MAVFMPGESTWLKSMVGYLSLDSKELDMIEAT